MKILTLRFANLNSLKGEWLIDFRNPAYANEGIFVITGATGAGKSTILDAICLALYGATPRLGDITQNKNDIMSRQTGECFAEVVFLTNSNTYRASWGQKRAYGKADGKLQSPKHEIAYFVSDEVQGDLIEDKAQRTKLKIEAITGMDFGRFTRAMLLAQGGFSAFLQASADERSPILEQITGTEIYSDISKKVREIFSHEKKLLESLQDKLSGFSLLSEEQENALNQQKNLVNQSLNEQKNQIQHWQQCKNWRENLNEKLAQQQQLVAQQQQFAIQQQHFLADEQRLERALEALKLSQNYQYYQKLQQEIQQNQQKQANYHAQSPALQQSLHAQEQQLHTALQAFQQSEKQFGEQQSVFQQVRAYDYQINHLQAEIYQAQQKISEAKQFLSENQLKQTDCEQQKSVLEQQISDINTQQANHIILQEIPATLLKLEHYQQNLNSHQKNLQQTQDNLTKLEIAQQNHQQSVQSAMANITHTTQQLEQKTKQKQQLDNNFRHILQDWHLSNHKNPLKSLDEKIKQSQHTQQRLTLAEQLLKNWQNTQQQQQIYQENLINIDLEINNLQQKIKDNLAKQDSQKQQITLLNDNILLQHKILSLESERAKLISGEPCPLCGSTSHPYQQQKTQNNLNNSEEKLQNLQQDLAKLQQEWTLFSQALHQQQAQQQHFHSEQLQQTQQRQGFYQAFCQTLADLQQDRVLENLPDELAHCWQNGDMDFAEKNLANLQNYFNKTVETLNEKTQQQQAVFQQLEILQSNIEDLTGEIHELETIVQKLQHQQQLDEVKQKQFFEQYQALNAEKQHLTEQISQHQHWINELILPFYNFNPTVFAQSNFAQTVATLQALYQQFEQQKQLLKQLDSELNQCENQSIQLQNAFSHWQNEDKILQDRLATLQSEMQKIIQSRFAIFADKQVAQVEQQLISEKQQRFEHWQAQQNQYHQLLQSWQSLQENLTNIGEALAQQQPAFASLHTKLQQDFAELGFADEQDYCQSLLSIDEIKRLQQQREQLYHHINLLDNQLAELNTLLQNLTQQNLTDLPFAEICHHLENSQAKLSEFEREIGMLEQQLQHNHRLKQSQTALIYQLEAQQNVFNQWYQLDKLIGSSDGKKFRNFAQGLTFDIMINHANAQLAKMSERYLLVADKEQALTLNVIDNFQAGTVRTSKNLSGGESFIISLALALGLSNMASHKMQVNSLFLDEGFGTLDEDALDTALDTLSSLQQSGKLIGVISHIQALKERISSKIQVVPQTGGTSKIVGEGVLQLA